MLEVLRPTARDIVSSLWTEWDEGEAIQQLKEALSNAAQASMVEVLETT
jgi:hypothetical protein